MRFVAAARVAFPVHSWCRVELKAEIMLGADGLSVSVSILVWGLVGPPTAPDANKSTTNGAF